jgi:hypothetical protein
MVTAMAFTRFLACLQSKDFGVDLNNNKKITRKSSGGHQAKRRKEEKNKARGTGRHATASALPS